MNILLINNEEKSVFLFNSSGISEINKQNVKYINSILDGGPIIYVSEAIEINKKDIINLFKKIKPVEINTNRYIHKTKPGEIQVASANMSFRHDTYILLNEKINKKISESESIQNLLNNNMLEIVDHDTYSKNSKSQKPVVIKKEVKENNNILIPQGKTVDEFLDDLKNISDDNHFEITENDLEEEILKGTER